MSMQRAMRQCYRKAKFDSQKSAHKKCLKIIKEGGPNLYVYDCRNCGCYHLTKNKGAEGRSF